MESQVVHLKSESICLQPPAALDQQRLTNQSEATRVVTLNDQASATLDDHPLEGDLPAGTRSLYMPRIHKVLFKISANHNLTIVVISLK